MTLRELLRSQHIDPDKLLDVLVGQKMGDSGGITVNLADGRLDIHVIAEVSKQPPPEDKPKRGARKKA